MRNLVIVVVDTMRRLDSLHGFNASQHAPFLTTLYRDSASFQRMVASSPWTIPSHWSLLSGIEAWKTGFREGRPGINNQRPSFAKKVREKGGESVALFQNELLSRDPTLLSDYDDRIGPRTVGLQRLSSAVGGLLDPALGITLRKVNGGKLPASDQNEGASFFPDLCYEALGQVARGMGVLLTAARTSRIWLTRLERHLKIQKAEGPRHVFVNLMNLHEPYISPTERQNRPLAPGWPSTSNLSLHSSNLCQSIPNVDALHTSYLASLRVLDNSLRELFRVFSSAGVLEDALVCVTSDHGQSLGENGFFGHGWFLNDELVRVPTYLLTYGNTGDQACRSEVSEWVDHRHLHDVIIDQLTNPSKPILESVKDAVERRGPAISYFRGTPISGFHPTKRLDEIERVRVWSEENYVELKRANRQSNPQLERSSENDVDRLISKANQVLAEATEFWDRDVDKDTGVSVAERLEKWGYT